MILFAKDPATSLLCKPFSGSPCHPVGNQSFYGLQSPIPSGPFCLSDPTSYHKSLSHSISLTQLSVCSCLRCMEHTLPAPQAAASTWDALPLASSKPWSATSLRSVQKCHLLITVIPSMTLTLFCFILLCST